MRDVLKNLIDGMSEAWIKVGKYWRMPCKSAITQARQRLGARVMSDLFHRLVRPMATIETMFAFLNGLRIVVIDFFLIPVFCSVDTHAPSKPLAITLQHHSQAQSFLHFAAFARYSQINQEVRLKRKR